MRETAKERIYRGALETMSDSDFMGNKYVKKFVGGVFKQIEDVPSDTDSLSQEQLNTAKKYIEYLIGTIKHDGHLGTVQTDWILPNLEKALAAIGGDDDRE